jgi:hypothetical protein
MQTYHIETTMTNDGTLTIDELPFHIGEKIEVILRRRNHEKQPPQKYPLRGKLIRYDNPFESVAENDWDALQ